MTSEHAKLMGGLVGVHAAQFGTLATYTPPSGASPNDPIRVENAMAGSEFREKQTTDEGLSIRIVRDVTLITDSRREGFCGVSNPVRGSTVKIDSVEYAVEMVTNSGGEGTETLKCVRHELNAFVREGYYRRQG